MKKFLCLLAVLALCLSCIGMTGAEGTQDGTLLYHEDFEDYAKAKSSIKVANTVGWKLQLISDGAMTDNIAKYTIASYNDSNQLIITNDNGIDSYFEILSSAQMGIYNQQNFTVQYDLLYGKSTSANNGISLLTQYNGSKYNEFLLTCDGVAKMYAFDNGVTHDYVEPTDVKSLFPINTTEGEMALQGVRMTIRMQVDWQNGITVYACTEGKDEWVKIASGKTDDWFSPETGAALCLKVTGNQRGYIDNIFVYTGLGQAPDTDVCVLDNLNAKDVCSGHKWMPATCEDAETCAFCGETRGEALGHTYKSENGYDVCTQCGKTRDEIENNWMLSGVPAYEGGLKASSLYNAGQGLEPNQPAEQDTQMALISDTSAEEFENYKKKLQDRGYTMTFENETEGNLYAAFCKDKDSVYAYYTACESAARVVKDTVSTQGVKDFGYTYTKLAGDTTVLYQVGLPMSENGSGLSSNGRRLDCGMMYVIKLADNSLMIMDGGGYQEFDDDQIEGVMKFLSEITGAGETDTIRIACWYISHGHNDHYSGLVRLFAKYHSRFTLERVMWNIPSVNVNNTFASAANNLNKLYGYIQNWFGNVEVLKCHTGETIQLADVCIDVIYTHEDFVDVLTGKTLEQADDYNNSCSVLMITFDGKKFLLPGDINAPAMRKILSMYTAETLKCDLVQIAHHVINNLADMYVVNQADWALVPQSPGGVAKFEGREKMMEIVKEYAENVYYASEGTTGVAVVDGELKVVYQAPVPGGDYTGWKW